MNTAVDNAPYFALVDDDAHSAHLLTRMLLAHGSPRVKTFEGADDAIARLMPALTAQPVLPTLVIVDLKAHSAANLEFVAKLALVAGKFDILIAVMAQWPDRQAIADLEDAGAAVVFTRHPELDAYRREAANIVSFWARNQRLDAVGM
jgi:ActR/RegA family two-component response regulator